MTKYSLFVDSEGEGYLLDVQADLLTDLSTRTVVPLIPQSSAPKAVKRLHPTFLIGGKSYVMLTHLIGTVSTAGLAESGISLAEQRGQVDAALDMLFEGF